MIETVLQTVVNGLITGAVIAIGAVGFTLIYGILRLVNVAHGELLTVGAYGAFVANVTLGLPLWLGLLAAVAASGLLAVATERAIWRPMRRQGTGRLQLMLMSIGLSIFLRSAVVFIWGSEFKLLNVDRNQTYFIFGLSISLLQIIVVATALVVLPGVGFLLQRTRLGKMMRALASNATLGEVSGIDTERVITITWLLAGALAGLAGALTGVLSVVDPSLGFLLLLLMFSGAILGGIGDAYGTLAGAFLLGLIQSFATLIINPSYAVAVSFAVMIVVLALRPRGIFNRAAAA